MKLLIITQKVDKKDDLLGFFHGWLLEFANYFEEINIICLEKGEYKLPANVKVFSLGKEKMVGRLYYFYNFFNLIWKMRHNYDRVFVHMNPEYIVLGGLVWRMLRKPVFLWYAHRLVDLKLKISQKIAKKIFTPAPESFQLQSDKIVISGHGIDIDKFKIASVLRQQKINDSFFHIIYVGRISKIKNQELLIKAANELINKRGVIGIQIDLVGGVAKNSQLYFSNLQEEIREYGLEKYIFFAGSKPYEKITEIYAQADLSINLCPLGGLDKAVLESMAAGLPVISSNASFEREFGQYAQDLIVKENDFRDLADKIQNLASKSQEKREKIGREMQDYVIEHHNLKKLIKFLSHVIQE